jgi:glutamate synthase domain-containing protein 2
MRRKWYLTFAVCMVLVFHFVIFSHDWRLFVLITVTLLVVAAYDLIQTKHSVLRNFPILGHIRYILEFIRPEIRQYFIADDNEEKPFSREMRSIVYQRSKNVNDTMPFGTIMDTKANGYVYMKHSIVPVAPEEVEQRIVIGNQQCQQPYAASHLNISAMSFGAISPNAIEALNLGAKLGNFAHNTGEGGISRYHLQGGDLIFQIGTGYFGCRDDEGHFSPKEFQKESTRPEVKMIEVKLSQGAKPAHGGILPAAKVTPEIAEVRKVKMGHDILSPIAHTAFNTPIEMLEFIQKLRELSGGKPVGFKICIGQHHEFLAICKAILKTGIIPDFVTVDGGEGGTGAAPPEYSNHMGEPLDDALIFVHNALRGIGIRDQIRIIASGKIITGFDMVYHIALGADLFNSARGMMFALGCIQSRQCNANTCPTGVATQNQRLQRGLVVDEKKIRVKNFHDNTIKSFLEIVGAMGLTSSTQIKPYFLMKRIRLNRTVPLTEVYEFIEPGSLLGKNIPKNFKNSWDIARAEQFNDFKSEPK